MRTCPLASMVSEPSLIAVPRTSKFTEAVFVTRPQEFCLLWIKLEAVGRHPLTDICDAIFELLDSSRRHRNNNAYLAACHWQKHDMIICAMLIGILFEISSAYNVYI